MPQKTIEQRFFAGLLFLEPVLVVSISLGSVLLAVSIFRWTLVVWLTVFFEPYFERALGWALLAVSLWSLIHLVMQVKKRGVVRAATPLLVNIVVLLMVFFVPIDAITAAVDFRWNYHKRMDVVSDVLDGKLASFVSGTTGRGDIVHLPAPYQGLSVGGNIMTFRRDGQTLIFFFDFQGVLDSFSGFVYSTGDTKPKSGDFGGEFVEIRQLRPNWWWASSTN